MSFRLGVDIGGTFTDAVATDEATGEIAIEKVSTTPADHSVGVLQAIDVLRRERGLDPALVEYVVHATTVATNAVLERRGAHAGLLVTEGFRDVLEIGRQVRSELYNLQTEKLVPLIPRRRCMEIEERLGPGGDVLRPLDDEAVREAALALKEAGVEAIAICFLHSYANPTHEERAAELVREVFPDALISLSATIAPEIREYWRASTTVMNAYVGPSVGRYLAALEDKLKVAGFRQELHIMQSSGGIMTSAAAKVRPVYLVESGPAAGVAAAAFIAELTGAQNAISFDMGGTTAKMGLILDQKPTVLSEYEVGSAMGSGPSLVKGSGYPILTPVLDLVEVGAGGGSLAWIDSGGFLRVGPQSAGAAPGPVCYSRGGEQPTVTDANLVLGRLNAEYFLGGDVMLDLEAARRAVEEACALPLGLTMEEAAMGVIDIANSIMVQAMRLVSVQRGLDPRDFHLVAFGGAGPVHANALAVALAIPDVIIPPSPGVASALGMLVSNVRRDYRVTKIAHLADLNVHDLASAFEGLEAQAHRDLAAQGVSEDRLRAERYVDMRYVGQFHKLQIPIEVWPLTDATIFQLKDAFDAQHDARYGYSVDDEPAEIVAAGLSAIGEIPRVRLREPAKGGKSARAAKKGAREAYFGELGKFSPVPIYDRYALLVGNRVPGPAIIEERDSSTVVHPGFVADVIQHGVLHLRRS